MLLLRRVYSRGIYSVRLLFFEKYSKSPVVYFLDKNAPRLDIFFFNVRVYRTAYLFVGRRFSLSSFQISRFSHGLFLSLLSLSKSSRSSYHESIETLTRVILWVLKSSRMLGWHGTIEKTYKFSALLSSIFCSFADFLLQPEILFRNFSPFSFLSIRAYTCVLKKMVISNVKNSQYDRWASTAFNRYLPSLPIRLRHRFFSGQSSSLHSWVPRHATDAHSCEHRTNGVWGNWWTSGTRYPEIGWKSDEKKRQGEKERRRKRRRETERENTESAQKHRFRGRRRKKKGAAFTIDLLCSAIGGTVESINWNCVLTRSLHKTDKYIF